MSRLLSSLTIADVTLIQIDARARRSPQPLSWSVHAPSGALPARGARSALQGACRSGARRNREPPRGGGRGLRLRSQCHARPRPTDGLAPPPCAPRGGARRVEPPWDLGLLPARARSDRAAAGDAGRMTRTLFVCVENAGRSQIAQALYELRGGEARSAGSQPAAELHEAVVEALDEIGIDVSGLRPKPLTREDVEWADLVVTMGCGDACPVLPGKEYVDWDLPDPAGLCLEEVRG